MNRIRKIGLTLAGLLACGSAQAQPSSAYSWNGFYLGAHAAFVDGRHDLDVGVPFNLRPDGYAAGFQIGYLTHLSRNWVVGFEADISFADVKDTTSFPGLAANLERLGTARTRFGYAQGPVLIYGTGGFAWGARRRTSRASSIPTSPTPDGPRARGSNSRFRRAGRSSSNICISISGGTARR